MMVMQVKQEGREHSVPSVCMAHQCLGLLPQLLQLLLLSQQKGHRSRAQQYLVSPGTSRMQTWGFWRSRVTTLRLSKCSRGPLISCRSCKS